MPRTTSTPTGTGDMQVDGNNMSRTTFTENYPRKFARRLAKSLCKLRVPREKPYLQEEEQCLWSWTLAHGSDHGDRVTKRIRMSPQAKLKVSRARDVEQLPWGKRCKLSHKTTPIDAMSQWQSVFQELQSLAPRVGKVEVTNPHLVSQVQALIGDKIISKIIICRGTNRTIGPPKTLMKGEAPFRRCIFTERNHWKNSR